MEDCNDNLIDRKYYKLLIEIGIMAAISERYRPGKDLIKGVERPPIMEEKYDAYVVESDTRVRYF